MPKSPNHLRDPSTHLIVRNATLQDVSAIVALSERVYKPLQMEPYTPAAVTGQINNFPRGQIVVLVGENLVGYCATFRIAEKIAMKAHTWNEITGNGERRLGYDD